jgi:hypothetical protein
MPTETQTLKLEQIRIDGGTQPRVAIDEQVVADYAESYSTGVSMPPVTVFFDGATYWLADGFHRYWANKRIDCEYIIAEVHQGTQRDAVLYSVGANAGHGLRRTNADKRKAVLTMLTDPNVCHDESGTPWSDLAISRRCCVSAPFVAKMRASCQEDLTPNVYSENRPQRRAYTTKHGTAAVMTTSNIGRKIGASSRKHASAAGSEMNPVRQPRPALAQTSLNLPHDPQYGARAIVSAMGAEYARQLIDSLTDYLEHRKEGDA